jgi:N-acetyl sugar amidotransferase
MKGLNLDFYCLGMDSMKYCKNCLFPDTKPKLDFDKNGVCNACNFAKIKSKTNWDMKKEELRQLIDKFKNKDSSTYDCIVPVSGGKDSTFQAYYLKSEFKINPLLVCFRPRDFTDLGRKNLENLKELGFDCIEITANPTVYKKLAKFGLEELGDIAWPEHMGLFAAPFQVAVEKNIQLIIWGENSALEYGGPKDIATKPFFDKKYDDKHGAYFQDKIKAEDMVQHGFKLSELKLFMYPPENEINQLGIVKAYLGNYINWDARSQTEIIKKLGFSVLDKSSEGTYTNYENLDTRYVALHDYFKWLKYGFGRATDHASIDIRNGRLSRDEGLKLVKQHEGKIPTKYMDNLLDEFGYTQNDFTKICDKFTNKDLFKTNSNDNLIRDEIGNIEKIVYDN